MHCSSTDFSLRRVLLEKGRICHHTKKAPATQWLKITQKVPFYSEPIDPLFKVNFALPAKIKTKIWDTFDGFQPLCSSAREGPIFDKKVLKLRTTFFESSEANFFHLWYIYVRMVRLVFSTQVVLSPEVEEEAEQQKSGAIIISFSDCPWQFFSFFSFSWERNLRRQLTLEQRRAEVARSAKNSQMCVEPFWEPPKFGKQPEESSHQLKINT